MRFLRSHAADGGAAVVATHDVELAAAVATRVVMLAGGETIADGDPGSVLGDSHVFAPQMTRVFGPGWLTPEQVAGAGRERGARRRGRAAPARALARGPREAPRARARRHERRRPRRVPVAVRAPGDDRRGSRRRTGRPGGPRRLARRAAVHGARPRRPRREGGRPARGPRGGGRRAPAPGVRGGLQRVVHPRARRRERVRPELRVPARRRRDVRQRPVRRRARAVAALPDGRGRMGRRRRGAPPARARNARGGCASARSRRTGSSPGTSTAA